MSRKHKAKPAPMYTATDALNAHGLNRPSPKRFTVSEAERQMAALKANIDRITMRLSKATEAGNTSKVETLSYLLSRSQAIYRELVQAYESKGGTIVHPARLV